MDLGPIFMAHLAALWTIPRGLYSLLAGVRAVGEGHRAADHLRGSAQGENQ
jgi:hypothetical protein